MMMKTNTLAPWQNDLIKGYRYDVGEGVRPSRSKAEKFYLRATESGSAMSQYYLAQLYFSSGKKDLKKAVFWWSKAAENGHAFAQCNLGRAYENGEGVRKNISKAKRLYLAAAKQGDAIARFNLARLKARSGLLPKAQTEFKSIVPELQKIARRREASSGSARTCLAQCAYHGWGMKMSKQQAVKWYRSAAKKGEADGFLGLAHCYQDGDGVRRDAKKAKHYFAMASRNARVVKI